MLQLFLLGVPSFCCAFQTKSDEEKSKIEEGESFYKQTDNEKKSDIIVNEDVDEYPEKEIGDHVITRRNNIRRNNIGQKDEA